MYACTLILCPKNDAEAEDLAQTRTAVCLVASQCKDLKNAIKNQSIFF